MTDYELYERRSAQQARSGKALDIILMAALCGVSFRAGWEIGAWFAGALS